LFYVRFSFNGIKRDRELPELPMAGEIVELAVSDDKPEFLRVDLVIHS
jgi:hypothetical protein